MPTRLAGLYLILFFTATLSAQYDLVILNGHIMDPASGRDAVANVGIANGHISAITTRAITGKDTIDATGLIVAPGFIDIHDHGQDDENYRYKARDGVTTALEMEVGANPVESWYKAREGRALINFGATSGHIPARMAVMRDTGTFLPRDNAVTRAATPGEVAETLNAVRVGLDQHALGIGMGIAYMPKTTREEILDIFRLSAQRHAPIYVHMRNPGPVDPGVVDSLQEVIGDAAVTGASLHIVHITSMAFRQTPLALEMIDGAKKRGLDVTTECYPYTAGQTQLESAVFDEGWQERLGISYGDLQWTATGERLTAETFAKYRKQGGPVVIHSIPEDMVRLALSHPGVIVASDGWLVNGKGHPRAAGTYARVLSRYVREQKVLPLMEALRRMTILPAERVRLTNKGRLREGADADITVFDAARVADKATYEQPAQYSEGIPYVIVNGVPVVRQGQLLTNSFPGSGVRAGAP
ncbi:MAG TPA: amidohydrolase family protein [Bryobacteraceae bacterium]|nr:amidohydrolase family protein [Bryobacteraceae bacterium]